MYRVTPGIAKVLGRRMKKRCMHCQLPIPVYPGRYPRNCPHCQAPWDDAAATVEALLSGDMSAHELFEVDSVDTVTASEQELAFDKIMRLVNTLGLLEPLIGTKIAEDGTAVWLYFAESAKPDVLDKLIQELKQSVAGVQRYDTTEGNAKWVISISQPRSREEPEVSGSVPASPPVSGDVTVTRGA